MAELVIVDYQDLMAEPDVNNNNKLSQALEDAFGKESSYGILAIRGVPDFVQCKLDCLQQAHPLTQLPLDDLSALEDPTSLYNAGWSRGKESVKANLPDMAKASFYFNPVTDVPGTPEDRLQFPASYPINKWPKESLPTLEPAAKRLGCLLKDVTVSLSRHLDAYVASHCPTYPPSTLYDALKDTEKVKGRLLYYFPLTNDDTPAAAAADHNNDDDDNGNEDSWFGFHNDSGYLTALAGDIYLDPNTGQIVNEDDQDQAMKMKLKKAGLYVEDRNQTICHVPIPLDCMAIQIGECTQVVTGGAVRATPHGVKGAPHVARVSLACFIDVPPSTPISAPPNIMDDVDGESWSSHFLAQSSSRVPPLSKRWHPDMTFGDFLAKTFQMYYEWNQNGNNSSKDDETKTEEQE